MFEKCSGKLERRHHQSYSSFVSQSRCSTVLPHVPLQDEIDALFDATLGKKVKKAELSTSASKSSKEENDTPRKAKSSRDEKGDKKNKKRKDRDDGGADRDLTDILGAIRSAPKDDRGSKKRKKAH